MKPLQYVPFYVLWIISSALSVLDWFLLRAATVAITDAIQRAVPMEVQIERGWYLRWMVRAANPCSLVFFSIFAFASIVAFDHIYRTAIEKGTIKKRFGLVTSIQAGILIVCAIILLVTNLVV
jgi:hypothetical protein